MDHWCLERREDLIELAQEKHPLLVYNEEILNESVFDLLSVEAVERIFQDVEAVRMLEVLRKVYELGAGFRVNSAADVDRLSRLMPELDPRRVLFVPPGDRWEDDAFVLKTGMQTVTSIHTLKLGRDGFGKHPVLLRVPLRGDAFHPRHLERSLSANLAGIYVGAEGTDFLNLKDMLPKLHELASLFPKPLTVCLGDGVGLPIDTETDSIITKRLEEQMEEIMEVYPALKLWVEPGRHLVSRAGILLTKLTGPDEQSIPLDLVDGSYHAVYNLARPKERAQAVPFEKSEKSLGDIFHGVKNDDVLVITNVGGYGRKAGWNSLPTHYLKARRICQVRL